MRHARDAMSLRCRMPRAADYLILRLYATFFTFDGLLPRRCLPHDAALRDDITSRLFIYFSTRARAITLKIC